MDELKFILLYGVAVPAGIAAILLLRSPGRLAAALALPMISYVLIRNGWTGEAKQFTIFAPLAGLAVGLMMAFAPRTIGVRAILAVILGALVTVALWPIIKSEVLLIQLFPGAAAMLLLALIEPMGGPKAQPSFALGLSICAGATGAILMAAYKSPSFAVPMIALAVALLVIAAVMWKRRELTLASGPLAVVAASFAAFPLVTFLYCGGMDGKVAPISFAILTATPLLMWGGVPGGNGEVSSKRGGVIRITLAILACGAAGVFAYIDQRPVEKDDDAPAEMSDAEQSMHDAMMEMMQGGGSGSGGDGADNDNDEEPDDE